MNPGNNAPKTGKYAVIRNLYAARPIGTGSFHLYFC
jgi:hypothetical protein